MRSDDTAADRTGDALWRTPSAAVAFGMAATLLAWVATFLLAKSGQSLAAPALLHVLGLLAAGIAVARRPASSAILGGASAVAWLTWLTMPPAWDSLRVIVGVAATVALTAAVVMLMPRLVRRIVISLFILFHFGAILCAITSVPPQPWISLLVWTKVYRPYLEFLYLNNAYHFYSPDPGPPTLIWAYVKYDDGTARWVKVPHRDDYPLTISYQRRLAMTESINQLIGAGSVPAQELQSRAQSRLQAGNTIGVPPHPNVDVTQQYREPVAASKRMLETYARYFARHSPHLDDPTRQVTSLKLYRVVHQLPGPRDLAIGLDPQDETSYWPYYQGEYNPRGELLNPQDPLLYWLIPILRESKRPEPAPQTAGVFRLPQNQGLQAADERGGQRHVRPEDTVLRDFLKVHAEFTAPRATATPWFAVGKP